MKVRIIIITSITVFLFFIMLVFSSSFKNIYFYKDKYLIINSNNGSNNYTFYDGKKSSDGVIDIVAGKISFVYDNNVIATAIYDNKNRSLVLNGKFSKKNYKGIKFKQVSSISEYFRTVF